MATRSTIAIENLDGTVDMIYCHWDGYLSHNGLILAKHWQDPDKLQQMIQRGDMSILGTEVGSQHDFDNRNDGECTFYGRDRGETGVDARHFAGFEDYEANHQYEEYEYILRSTRQWYVCEHGNGYEPLEDAVFDVLEGVDNSPL